MAPRQAEAVNQRRPLPAGDLRQHPRQGRGEEAAAGLRDLLQWGGLPGVRRCGRGDHQAAGQEPAGHHRTGGPAHQTSQE